jgi:hypothetical protein
MMQMLQAGGMETLTDGLRPADVDNPRGYLEYEPVKRTRQDASWLARAGGKAVKVIHLLLRDLPGGYDYRVILLQRPMEEVLASQGVMLERAGRVGAALASERLAEVFRSQLSEAEAWMAAQAHFCVLSVQYHDCLRDGAGTARRVNAFLGGGLDETAMTGEVEPQLHRQRG